MTCPSLSDQPIYLTMSTSDPTKLARRLGKVKHILLVLSGKGGVGKSSVSVQIALSLLNQGQAHGGGASDGAQGEDRKPVRIGLLDIDLTGPSIPRMLGLDGASIHQSNDGWVPVYLPIQHLKATPSEHMSNQEDDRQPEASTSALPTSPAAGSSSTSNGTGAYPTQDELKVMSIGFLLKDSRQAVVWRGPKKSAMIRQFLADVRWGELDWLIIDTPPGRSTSSSFLISRCELLMRPLFSMQARPMNIYPFLRICSLHYNPIPIQLFTLYSSLHHKQYLSQTYRKNSPSPGAWVYLS